MRTLPREIYLVVAATFLFFVSLDFHGTVYPLYLRSLGAGEGMIGLFVGLMTFAAIGQRIPLARLARRHLKLVFLIGMGCWAAAPLIYLMATNLYLVGLARFLQGMGPAAVITSTQLLAAELAPDKARGQAIALQGMADNAGILVGPAAGYLVFQLAGLTGFWLSVMVIALAAIGIMLPVPEPRGSEKPGSNLMVGSRKMVAGTVRIAGQNLRSILILGFLLGLPFGVAFSFVPLHVLKMAANPSYFFVFMSGASILARVGCGRFIDKHSSLQPMWPGILVLAGGFFAIAVAGTATFAYLSALLIGAGIGITHTAVISYIVEHTGRDERPLQVAREATACDVGISVGSMGLGWLVETSSLGPVCLVLSIIVLSAGSWAVFGLRSSDLRPFTWRDTTG